MMIFCKKYSLAKLFMIVHLNYLGYFLYDELYEAFHSAISRKDREINSYGLKSRPLAFRREQLKVI